VDALGQLIGREASAEGGGDRVAGEADEEEDQRHEDQDGREDQQEPDQDVPARGLPPDPRRGPPAGGGSVTAASMVMDVYLTERTPRAGIRCAGSGRVSYFVIGAKRSLNDASSVTPHVLAGHGDLSALQQRHGREVAGDELLDLLDVRARRGIRLDGLLEDQVVHLGLS
jgi:hypothetical protein